MAPQALPVDPSAEAILNHLSAAVLVVDSHRRIFYRNAPAKEWFAETLRLDEALSSVYVLGPFQGWEKELASIGEPSSCKQWIAARHGNDGDRENFEDGAGSTNPGSASADSTGYKGLYTLRCMPLKGKMLQGDAGYVLLITEESLQPVAGQAREAGELCKRLESLGKLTTRVAHELNNPLDGILRFTNLALSLVESTSQIKLKSYLMKSRVGLLRMMQIISELLEFSRSTEGAFIETNVNEVVEQALVHLGKAAEEHGIVVAVDLQSRDMPIVRGSRLYQICCNLIKNAIDAMPQGGRLIVTTGRLQDDVVIQIADTGPGLPCPADQLFESFFTTKAPGKGTGLGLAICKEYVQQLKGTIDAGNGEEGGAVFTVRIPESSFSGAAKTVLGTRQESKRSQNSGSPGE